MSEQSHIWNDTGAIPFCMACGGIDITVIGCPGHRPGAERIADLQRQLAEARKKLAAVEWLRAELAEHVDKPPAKDVAPYIRAQHKVKAWVVMRLDAILGESR